MKEINKQRLQKIIKFLQNSKDKLLKASQYIALIFSWHYQNAQDQQKKFHYFLIYSHIFHLRRIYRLGYSISILPKILLAYYDLKKQINIQKVACLIKDIAKFLFYIFDNASVAMKLIKYKYYGVTRRVSFSIFAFAIIVGLIYNLIKLKKNFSLQTQIKSQMINNLTPIQFLKKLSSFDQQRKQIILDIFSNIGDLVPALQRINLPESLLRIKIDRGVVGVFGLLTSTMQIIKSMKSI